MGGFSENHGGYWDTQKMDGLLKMENPNKKWITRDTPMTKRKPPV